MMKADRQQKSLVAHLVFIMCISSSKQWITLKETDKQIPNFVTSDNQTLVWRWRRMWDMITVKNEEGEHDKEIFK